MFLGKSIRPTIKIWWTRPYIATHGGPTGMRLPFYYIRSYEAKAQIQTCRTSMGSNIGPCPLAWFALEGHVVKSNSSFYQSIAYVWNLNLSNILLHKCLLNYCKKIYENMTEFAFVNTRHFFKIKHQNLRPNFWKNAILEN